DAGVGLGLLYLPVNAVLVLAVADRAEVVVDVDVNAELVATACQAPLTFGKRLFGERVGPVEDHRVVIVDRYPHVAVVSGPAGSVDRIAADLVPRHHPVIAADEVRPLRHLPDAAIAV